MRSRSRKRSVPGPIRATRSEKLYVIRSLNYSGALIYTKGKIGQARDGPVLYVLISSKIATIGD